MAVKFRRDDFRDTAAGSHGRFTTVRWRRARDPKQRLLIIYIGVAGMLIAIFVVRSAGFMHRGLWLAPQEGVGVVVDKRILGEDSSEPHYYLVVGLAAGPALDGQTGSEGETASPGEYSEQSLLVDHVLVDEASWNLVETGTAVSITFRLDDSQRRISIDSITMLDTYSDDLEGSFEGADSPDVASLRDDSVH